VFAIFEDVGMSEILVIGIFGVLLFGKRLPEVASQAGAQLVKFRRSLQQVKAESGMDQEVHKIRRAFEEAIPRDLSVGEVARLASARVQERIQNARKELDLEVGKPLAEAAGSPAAQAPPAEPPHEPGQVGPPASDLTIARIRAPDAKPAAGDAPPSAG
jgi:Sec-independent protein translocase protein TatA